MFLKLFTLLSAVLVATKALHRHTFLAVENPDQKNLIWAISESEPIIDSERQGRQDSGEDELPTPQPLAETGANVAQILTGVFGGNLTSILHGSTGFIPETDVRQDVGFLLAGVGNPLTMAWQYVVERVSHYFGYTTPKPYPANRGTYAPDYIDEPSNSTTRKPKPGMSANKNKTASANALSKTNTTTLKPTANKSGNLTTTNKPLNATSSTTTKLPLIIASTVDPDVDGDSDEFKFKTL